MLIQVNRCNFVEDLVITISFIFMPPSFPRSRIRILDGRSRRCDRGSHITTDVLCTRGRTNVPPRMKTRRTYSHIHKASLTIIVPRYPRDVGELRDLTRGIVITGEIYHLRSPSFSPIILPFFSSLLILFLRAATHCVTRACTLCTRDATLSGRALFLSSILRMRDANGRLSRIPRSRFARNNFSLCRDLFTNDFTRRRVKSSQR